MEFAQKSEGGHMGPRKFWRENLPRLKFWNPAIPMIVNRTKEQQGAATMTLYFRTDDRASTAPDTPIPQLNSATDGSSPAPEPQPGEQTIVIDMKERHSSSILDEFLEKTGAVPVMPTPQENADLQAIEEMKKRSEIDREKKRVLREAQKREKAFLAEARSEAAALKNSAA
ncbi:hypothetical protein VTK73DRAFT_4778 [Phialemonium thermophilum]|uniref:Ribosomal protein/NADH dehydrogenase domain-containing protein n=1 Tax=Phialemonium thermophilum TaxID=223376 RepID=A0ABR3XYL8_9PEZI